tara:strand:- start:319 stop:1293 length:975 start_codon:yes stop_codon:yes gene_type:complete
MSRSDTQIPRKNKVAESRQADPFATCAPSLKQVPLETVVTGDFGKPHHPLVTDPRDDVNGALRRRMRVLNDRYASLSEDVEQLKWQSSGADRARSAFLANLSHELRTPLNAIIGFSDSVLLETHGPIENRKYREYIEDIRSSGGLLLRMIEDLLDVAQLEAGNVRISAQRLNIGDLLDSGVEQAASLASHHGVDIRQDRRDGMSGVYGDGRYLSMAVGFLLSDAVRRSSSGESVTVSADQRDGNVEIAICDTAKSAGMVDAGAVSGEEMAALPEGIAGLEMSGICVGMSTVRAIAEMHGGTLTIDRKSGQGRKAILTLAAAPQD